MSKCLVKNQPPLYAAPMVRVSTLPFRLLCLRFGASLAYSEETIDTKLLESDRVVNRSLGTIDYLLKDGTVVFRTCEEEAGRVVLQIASANPDRAAECVAKVAADVERIDLNMGCPKSFSISGGMGAALMSNQDNAVDVLTAMRRAAPEHVRITCKTRLFPSLEENVSFLQKLCASGAVSAIAVHARLREERPRHEARCGELSRVFDALKDVAANNGIELICNGGSNAIHSFSEMLDFHKQCGACHSSVMVARAAFRNASIFSGSLLDELTVQEQFLSLCLRYLNCYQKTKYCLLQMMKSQETPLGIEVRASASLSMIATAFGLSFSTVERPLLNTTDTEPFIKKRKIEGGDELIIVSCKYNRKQFRDKASPKCLIHSLCRSTVSSQPIYATSVVDQHCYSCTLTLSSVSFSTSSEGIQHFSVPFVEKSKKVVEQSCALAALLYHEIISWSDDFAIH